MNACVRFANIGVKLAHIVFVCDIQSLKLSFPNLRAEMTTIVDEKKEVCNNSRSYI